MEQRLRLAAKLELSSAPGLRLGVGNSCCIRRSTYASDAAVQEHVGADVQSEDEEVRKRGQGWGVRCVMLLARAQAGNLSQAWW